MTAAVLSWPDSGFPSCHGDAPSCAGASFMVLVLVPMFNLPAERNKEDDAQHTVHAFGLRGCFPSTDMCIPRRQLMRGEWCTIWSGDWRMGAVAGSMRSAVVELCLARTTRRRLCSVNYSMARSGNIRTFIFALHSANQCQGIPCFETQHRQ